VDPYRDSVLVYGALAAVIVLVAWLTGGGVVRAIVIAAFFFVLATAWSIYRWRGRLREADERARRGEAEPP
jgi:membrane protein implicated in regulation of membrane protease activity